MNRNIIYAHDITNEMTVVIQWILEIFHDVIEFMDGLQFFGTSMFRIMLGVGILGIAIPIVLTISKNIVNTGERIRPRGERKENDN